MTTATKPKPAPRPLSPEAKARRDREAAAERRPILIGLLGTVLVHLLLFFIAPYLKPSISAEAAAAAVEAARQAALERDLAVELQTEEQLKNFVDANPNSPDEEPEKTTNFGAKNTRAGQPDPGKDETDRAKTDGKLDKSPSVVTGQRNPEPEAPPPGNNAPTPQNAEMQANVQTNDPRVAQSQNPLPGLEKIMGDNPDGVAMNLGKNPENAKDVDKPVEGKKDGDPSTNPEVVVNGQVSPSGMPGRPGPRPRPRVQNARPVVLARQPLSSGHHALVPGIDCKLNQFGEYLDKVFEAIESRWYEVLDKTKARPPTPSHVQIKFRIYSDGTVKIEDLEEDAGTQGTYCCRDAITTPAPYEKWTPEMVAFVGRDFDEVTITFYYQ